MRKQARVAVLSAALFFGVVFVAGFGSARTTPNDLPGNYDNMGEEEGGNACRDVWDWLPDDFLERCAGYPAKDLADVINSDNHKNLIKFLKKPQRWHPRTFVSKRQRADSNPDTTTWPTHEIQAIKNPQKLRYLAVPRQGTMLGKITVSSGAEEDKYYGLKDDPAFERTYFLMSEPYAPASNETPGGALGDRWRISRWYLLGIRGTGNAARVVRMPKTGVISWCGHGHDPDVRADAARFLTCDGQRTAQLIRSNEAAMATLRAFAQTDSAFRTRPPTSDTTSWIIDAGRQLVGALQAPRALSVTVSPDVRALLLPLLTLDPFSDPVWMTCGVGCCIAET